MSTIPQSLSDVKRYLVEKTGKEGKNFGIRGAVGSRRVWGYHLGRADIYGPGGYGDKDYSNRRLRDRRGLSEASAGLDIRLPVRDLKTLAAFLLAEAKLGRADLMEIIGPNSAGAAKRWVRPLWTPLTASADHEWHIHLSFPRDTEFSDRRQMFVPLYGPISEPEPEPVPDPPPEPVPDPPPPVPSELELLRERNADLEDAIKTAQDALSVG